MCGKYQDERQNIKSPNTGKRTRGGGRGGEGCEDEWVTGTEGGT